MDHDLARRYRFFRERASWVGHAAEQAIALARTEREGEARGLAVRFVPESEAWDGEGPAPEYLLCVFVVDENDSSPRPNWLASVGMVGVNSLDDPYLRVVGAELMREALPYVAIGKPNATCDDDDDESHFDGGHRSDAAGRL